MKYDLSFLSRVLFLIFIVGMPMAAFAQEATDYTTLGESIEITNDPSAALICPTVRSLIAMNSEESNIPDDPDSSSQPMTNSDRVFIAALNKTQHNEIDAGCLDLPTGATVTVMAQHTIDPSDQSLSGYKDWIGVNLPSNPGDPVDQIIIPKGTEVETHLYDPNAASENDATTHPLYTTFRLQKDYLGWLDTYYLNTGP